MGGRGRGGGVVLPHDRIVTSAGWPRCGGKVSELLAFWQQHVRALWRTARGGGRGLPSASLSSPLHRNRRHFASLSYSERVWFLHHFFFFFLPRGGVVGTWGRGVVTRTFNRSCCQTWLRWRAAQCRHRGLGVPAVAAFQNNKVIQTLSQQFGWKFTRQHALKVYFPPSGPLIIQGRPCTVHACENGNNLMQQIKWIN